jgi:excisionase family DNA binding protein
MITVAKWRNRKADRIREGMAIEENSWNEKKAVTVEAAADLLGVSVRTVWRMIADGQLHAIRVRRCTRLAVAEVLGYLEQAKQRGCA